MINFDVSPKNKELPNLGNDNSNGIAVSMKRRNLRMADMQSVVANKLAMGQTAVNNAENYPSTWTTNPDGGANGQA